MTIDAHQHFWKYEPVQHAWISDEMSVIRKDFYPADLEPVLAQNKVDGCIAVQADETEEETVFLTALASKNRFIKAVVGWVDLRAANISERLEHYKQFNIIKGFRHILQGQDPSYMLQADFLNGIAALQTFNYTYDILIYPKHIPAAIEMVKQNPGQLFVIDHLAKPYIKAGLIDEWAKGMRALAAFDNVYCKISGMVTEASFRHWKQEDFTPYLDVAAEAFGTGRLMYGSDWPVCLAAASYSEALAIVANYFRSFSPAEKAGIFGNNALRFYNIDTDER